LEATDPNQLWSWDITMLHGPGKHTYRLYTIMDVFSRKVVGHRVEYSETAAFASALIQDAVAVNRQSPRVLHADNGAPMRAGTTLELADADGDVVATFTTAKSTQNVVFSSAAIKDGDTYTVSSGGTTQGTGTAGEESTGGMGGGGRGPR